VILATISLTIVVSVYAHGLSALPLTDRYVAWLRSHARPEPLARDTGA
jgi:sodium/hydrogen antiporter